MARHVNIPIFIPHLGCPNQCVFCNQRTISGVREFDPASVVPIIEEALSTVDPTDECEIAFFGGSFTGIDRALMTELLETAYSYVRVGRVTSIRCSTRPDYIDEEIIEILKRYGVRTVELGLQSSSDTVLEWTKRGHTYHDEKRAARLITEAGLELVGQMMIGLPGATPDSELATARFIIESGAHAARIYPTVVFRETELCSMADHGIYTPLSLDEAVERSASVFALFLENNIDVIRIGLCASDNLLSEETYHSGPNHPAIGEMVINRYYLDKILGQINAIVPDKDKGITVFVSRGSVSKAIGQKKINKLRLESLCGVGRVAFREDASLAPYAVRVTAEVGDNTCI